jgi:hypothetical protein
LYSNQSKSATLVLGAPVHPDIGAGEAARHGRAEDPAVDGPAEPPPLPRLGGVAHLVLLPVRLDGEVDAAGVDRFLGQYGVDAVRPPQLHVDAGPQRQRGRLAARPGDRVPALQERDPVVVGDDDAGEAQPVAEQAGEQPLVGGRRDPVDIGVGVHDRADAALAQCHDERLHHDVGELAGAHGRRRHVPAAP